MKRKLIKKFRKWTASKRALPDFIIAGAQKAGTTSLYDYMVKHPGISTATRKEVHYYDNNYQRGINHYRSHFPLNRNRTTLTGEATPYYLSHPHALQRIAKDIPDVKFIIMLRNPADRAFSGYYHSVTHKVEKRDIETAFKEEAAMIAEELPKMLADENYRSRGHQHHSYVSRGHYAEQLTALYDLFPKENILILESADFFKNTKEATNKAFEFLDLAPFDLPEYGIKNIGKQKKDIPEALHTELSEYFVPFNETLYALIGQRFDW